MGFHYQVPVACLLSGGEGGEGGGGSSQPKIVGISVFV